MKVIEALPEFNHELLAYPEGRRALAENNPLMFALIYLKHHISFPGQEPTLNEFHLDMLDYAKGLKTKGSNHPPKSFRDLFIAPRNSGKSSWAFTIIPLWVGAFGHKRFVAAFSNKEEQAEGHLKTFKAEIEFNTLLRNDFPEFTSYLLTAGNKAATNNANAVEMANGFVFYAKGVDTGVLGMKSRETRPDLLLFDDIEPGESNYSVYQANQRRITLIDDLFMLNQWAHVVIVGTTTMQDSLIDQMRKAGDFINEYEGELEVKDAIDPGYRWVLEENINVHYWPAIITEADGERSIWPEVWPMDWLESQRALSTFQKNYMNNPTSGEAGYWSHDDIEIDEPAEYRGACVLSIDPAVTTKKASDFTGMTIVQKGTDGIIYVKHSEKFKLGADELKQKAADFIEKFGVNVIFIETNQGGDLWKQVFGGLNAKLKLTRSNAGATKSSRVAQAFDTYKQGKVKHVHYFPALVEEMTLYPNVKHDDTVDSLAQGVNLLSKKVTRVSGRQIKYTEDF